MDAPAPLDARQTPAALAPVLNALDAAFSERSLREMDPKSGNITSIKQDGKNVSITRDRVQSLPLTNEFLNGNVKLNSLDMAREVKFEIDPKTRTAANITGVTLNLTLLGENYGMDVTKVRLGHDAKGQKTLFTEMKNPLPEPGQRIVGMPPTFSVEIPVDGNGVLQSPQLSKVFADAASSTGPSIAGLLTSDALNEASKVALFVESNPKWVNYVVEPALANILRHLVTTPPVNKEEIKVPAQPAQPAKPGQVVNFPAATRPADVNAKPVIQSPAGPTTTLDVSKPGDYQHTMTVEGAERRFNVHVPPSYNGKTPMPLVILLHGHGQDGKTIAHHTKFNEMANREGFIAVYPDARAWAGRDEWRAWDTDNGLIPPGANADDVSFLRKIIEKSEADYKIDPKRIYMAGLSNGGMMSYRAAGELSDKLAAIAVVSGSMSGIEPSPKNQLSVMNIHGTEDNIVPYDGLRNVPSSLSAIGLPRFKSTEYATNFWAEQNKISNPPLILRNKGVTERRFINPDSGAEVNEYTIHGDDHVPRDINRVTNDIWKFFASHPKSTGLASGTQQPPEESFNLTKRLKSRIETRGMSGLQLDVGQMVAESRHLGNGSLSPQKTINLFEQQSGVMLDDTVSRFLRNAKTITKTGNNIRLDMEKPQEIPINSGGPVDVKSVRVGSGSFNLLAEKGTTALTDISGLSFNVNALGSDRNVPVTEIAQKVDGKGDPYYRMKATNPTTSWARKMILADKDIPIELQFNDQGQSTLLNEREVKDAALGINPVFRGYIDLGTHAKMLAERPGLGTGLDFGKDLGIMGGSGWAAYKFSPAKFGTKGKVGAAVTVGLIVAPAIIHGIERLRD